MKKMVDLNVRCPQCGSQEFVADTVYSSGVVLRCAHCSRGGKPTYIKNVSSDTFEALKRAGRIRQAPDCTYATHTQPLGIVPPTSPPVADIAPAEQSGSLSAPEVYSTHGVAFNQPQCGCCDPTMFGTAYDAFGMPLPNKSVNLVIRERQLILQRTRVGEEESGFAISVEYCPICGKKV